MARVSRQERCEKKRTKNQLVESVWPHDCVEVILKEVLVKVKETKTRLLCTERTTLEYFHPCDVGIDCMAKARPQDLAGGGVQQEGIRQEGHEGLGGLQEGVQGR